MPDKPRLAFIGTGIMGAPMTRNLLKAGYSVCVHNRTTAKARPLADDGATLAESPAAAAADADVVMSCVTDSPDVRRVYLDEDSGVISTVRAGSLAIDFSTIAPAVAREVADALADKDVAMLDAPVSGGDVGAQNGTLSIMVGGSPEAFQRARPLFEALGKTITHCGPSGAGQQTKLCNQVLCALNLAGVCEAIVLACKAGLDPEPMLAATSGGAAGSWSLSNLGPKIAAGDFEPGFMIDLIQKDLRLVFESSREAGASLPATALVHQLFAAAQADGLGRKGTQALYRVLADLAKLD